MSEIIYILENEAMPGFVKIGRTNRDVEQRVSELSNSTAVPFPFHCVYAATVEDAVLVERQIHMAFAAQRVRKEFFRLPAHCVISVLELVAKEIVTPRRRGVPVPDNVSPIVVRRPEVVSPSRAERDKEATLHALVQVNRPVSNDELAALMSVTKGESSRRASKLDELGLVKRDRRGKYLAISLTETGWKAAGLEPPPKGIPTELPLISEL